ncbi:methyltransferase family protein [Ketobacter alkanivorans]|uniref:Uncharacterized protein n=1 Tax=Ketobacter alkanivorans TaxID=1917421 RepID=A0A2K9LNJ2_9GAMM|nr:methyltransferase [Ketobacter alkanivorans]AUM13843.1 hypothetical protein Kalk_16030 [Ketobacter alkanivorans]
MTVYQHTNHMNPANGVLGSSQKAALILYSTISYLIGFSGLMAVILSMAGIIPMASWVTLTTHSTAAVIINGLLVCLFGLQHSIMARPFFKRAFNAWFTPASERSTYVWSSGVTLMIILALWQPVEGTLWQAQSLLSQVALWSLFALGWGYLFAATFSINHWDLFGLRQMWFAINDREYVSPEFKENWMYRYSRHPIMLGALIGMWCVPEMTASKFVLTAFLTLYVFVGVSFEEKDLIREFGQRYLEYKQRVGMFFTFR